MAERVTLKCHSQSLAEDLLVAAGGMIHSRPGSLTRLGNHSIPREPGLWPWMEDKGRKNSRQHANFLGGWLIALISQSVTIKASGMDGNNTRMGPKIRPKQWQSSAPRGWPQLSEAGPGAREEKCTGRDPGRTGTDQHQAPSLISTSFQGELNACKMNACLENLQRGFSSCPNVTQYFN